jgi:hypothetical protein
MAAERPGSRSLRGIIDASDVESPDFARQELDFVVFGGGVIVDSLGGTITIKTETEEPAEGSMAMVTLAETCWWLL